MENNTQNVTVDEIEESDLDMRKAALAAHLEIDVEGIEEARYGENQFEADGGEYLVLTDDEADQKAREYIEDSLWAFRPSFLADFTDLPEEVFTAMQDKCEGANDTVRTLVERSPGGVDRFIEEAVDADGRGHFVASYDFEEIEEGQYFIYRTN